MFASVYAYTKKLSLSFLISFILTAFFVSLSLFSKRILISQFVDLGFEIEHPKNLNNEKELMDILVAEGKYTEKQRN